MFNRGKKLRNLSGACLLYLSCQGFTAAFRAADYSCGVTFRQRCHFFEGSLQSGLPGNGEILYTKQLVARSTLWYLTSVLKDGEEVAWSFLWYYS